MDYLLRDAHYTGLKYGAYDRDYLLHHFATAEVGGQSILAIRQNALHCVEDFLMARFSWYSQVVRSARGAKYDALAEEMCFYLLEKGKIYTYSQLLELVAENPHQFYAFNDQYFMGSIHRLYAEGFFDKDHKYKEIAECLMFEKSPKTVRCEEFEQRILSQDDDQMREKYVRHAEDKVKEIEEVLKKKGTKKHWIVVDIPTKNILFVKSKKKVVKGTSQPNLLLERDPTKILMDSGEVKLLTDVEKSIISGLQSTINFVPNVYCSEDTYALLKSEGIVR
jgi:HD superfamily phosphohydrolase